MKDISLLSKAFNNFTVASKSLEVHYKTLQEKAQYLTEELKDKNIQLKNALYDTEEAKDYLNGVLQSLREGIVVLDTDGNITMINPAAEKLLGLEKENTIGKAYNDLDFSIENEGSDTFLIVKGKRYNVFLSRSDVLGSAGLIRGYVVLIQDITRMKELEAHKERNKRLIAMGEMAAKIVHEIRSPLCSIELYASMLEQELESTEYMNLARGISTGIKSLNNILTNMLFFAKHQKTLLKRIDLRETLDQSLSLLMPMIETRKIRLNKDTKSSVQIKGDLELLKQVFMNIFLNAIQVSPEGERIDVIIRKNCENAIVKISDNGTGIENKDIERVFDPFYSTKENGTGLGLTIASKIMQANGGKIKVESRVGKGSCFQLYFPIEEAEDRGKTGFPPSRE